MRREGFVVDHKRIYRIYDADDTFEEITPVTKPNQRLSLNFASDQLSTGRRFRALTIVANFSRECIAINVDFSLPRARVSTVLTRAARSRAELFRKFRISYVSQHFIDLEKTASAQHEPING